MSTCGLPVPAGLAAGASSSAWWWAFRAWTLLFATIVAAICRCWTPRHSHLVSDGGVLLVGVLAWTVALAATCVAAIHDLRQSPHRDDSCGTLLIALESAQTLVLTTVGGILTARAWPVLVGQAHQGHGRTCAGRVGLENQPLFGLSSAVGDLRLGVLGLHLRAQPLSLEPQPTRQAQADAASRIARELSRRGYSVIVLGDFNDFDGAPESLDRLGDTPITDVLAKIRTMDPAVPDDDLVNAASFLPREQRSTCFWDKNKNDRVDDPEEFSSIDHVLLSPDLARRVEWVRIPKDYDPREVTDHFPVIVRLRCDRPHHHHHR
jgi:hypothetical protein